MDWMDDLFGSGTNQPGVEPISPAYDPAVGLGAAAPFSGADAGGGLPQMGQTDARTGATKGTQNPDFLQILMRVLANSRKGQTANAISQTLGGPDLSKLDLSKMNPFGGQTKYTSTYRESPVPQPAPMQGGGGGDAGGKMAGIASLIEMY